MNFTIKDKLYYIIIYLYFFLYNTCNDAFVRINKLINYSS